MCHILVPETLETGREAQVNPRVSESKGAEMEKCQSKEVRESWDGEMELDVTAIHRTKQKLGERPQL